MTDEVTRRSGSRDSWPDSPNYKNAAKARRHTLILSCIGLLAGIAAWIIPVPYKETPRLITVGLAWFAVIASIVGHQVLHRSAPLAGKARIPQQRKWKRSTRIRSIVDP
jgi:hypothetical protein